MPHLAQWGGGCEWEDEGRLLGWKDGGFEVGYISWTAEYKSHAEGAEEGCGGLKLLLSVCEFGTRYWE